MFKGWSCLQDQHDRQVQNGDLLRHRQLLFPEVLMDNSPRNHMFQKPRFQDLFSQITTLRSQHEKAVVYFQRALKLNPGYLSALTLMGHEYMEMKNTHAAIQSYRQEVLFLIPNLMRFLLQASNRGEQTRLQSLVWSGTNLRDTQDAILLPLLLQTGSGTAAQ